METLLPVSGGGVCAGAVWAGSVPALNKNSSDPQMTFFIDTNPKGLLLP
jgi:hypothetical protein